MAGVSFRTVDPAELEWITRPHAEGEPARHVAALSAALGCAHVPANVWRYEPGAKGKRHVHAKQEETFVVLSGSLTMYVGEIPERVDVATGAAINVPAGTPLQSANHGTEDLVVYAYGYPPDRGAEVLEPAV
jgi:mannose-6-phosphate isomerase-like protein (cupin superfamily)